VGALWGLLAVGFCINKDQTSEKVSALQLRDGKACGEVDTKFGLGGVAPEASWTLHIPLRLRWLNSLKCSPMAAWRPVFRMYSRRVCPGIVTGDKRTR